MKKYTSAILMAALLVALALCMLLGHDTPEQAIQRQINGERESVDKMVKELREKQTALHALRAMLSSLDEAMSNTITQEEQKLKK